MRPRKSRRLHPLCRIFTDFSTPALSWRKSLSRSPAFTEEEDWGSWGGWGRSALLLWSETSFFKRKKQETLLVSHASARNNISLSIASVFTQKFAPPAPPASPALFLHHHFNPLMIRDRRMRLLCDTLVTALLHSASLTTGQTVSHCIRREGLRLRVGGKPTPFYLRW